MREPRGSKSLWKHICYAIFQWKKNRNRYSWLWCPVCRHDLNGDNDSFVKESKNRMFWYYKCANCGWDDMGFTHEPHCSSLNTRVERMDWEDVDFRFKNSFMPIKANYMGAPEDITEPILDFIHEAIQQAIAQERERIYNTLMAKQELVTYKKDNGHGVAVPCSHVMDIITNNHEDHKE